MKEINLSTAIIALFRQELTRTQIAKELMITVEDIDEIMGVFIFQDGRLPFIFKEKFDLLITPISDLALSPRVQNSLIKYGLVSFWETLSFSKEQLCKVKSFGKSSLAEFDTFILRKLLNQRVNIPEFFERFPTGIQFDDKQIAFLKKKSMK